MGWAGLDLPGERGGLFGPCVATDNHGRDPSPIPSRRIPRRTHPPLPLPSPLHARVGRTREPLVAVAAAVPSPEGERDEEEGGGQDEDDQGGQGDEPHRRLPQGAAEEGAQAGECLPAPNPRVIPAPRDPCRFRAGGYIRFVVAMMTLVDSLARLVSGGLGLSGVGVVAVAA